MSRDRNTPSDESSEEESEWRFGLEDVNEEGIVQEREPIEPGTPEPENVAFVLLGVVLAIVLLLQGIGLI